MSASEEQSFILLKAQCATEWKNGLQVLRQSLVSAGSLVKGRFRKFILQINKNSTIRH